MSDDASMPRSIGATPTDSAPTTTSLTDPALLRLYESLKGLDRALHDTLRALDVALGRDPSTGPPTALPMRELGRLKNQLEIAAGHKLSGPARPRLGDIALAVHEEPEHSSGESGGGTAPADD